MVYNSTAEFLKQQLQNFADATNRDKVLRSAVITSVAPIKARIQQGGEKSDGSQIGKYGNSVIPQAFGKAKTFANKTRLKKIRSTDTYKELRQKLGLQTQYVDLTFSGDMIRDLKPFPTGTHGYGIGFRSPDQLKVANQLEKKYGQIFQQQTEEEKATLQEINRLAISFLKR